MAKTTNTNAGKVRITHVESGKSFYKDPEVAAAIMERFKGAYKSEAIASAPKELTEANAETKDSGAAADQQADETKS